MDTICRFSAILDKGNNLYDFLFTFLHTRPLSEKGSTLIGKNLIPRGADSFLLGQTPFRRELKQFNRFISHESVSVLLKANRSTLKTEYPCIRSN